MIINADELTFVALPKKRKEKTQGDFKERNLSEKPAGFFLVMMDAERRKEKR